MVTSSYLEAIKRYRKNHPEKIREIKRRYYQKHKEKVKAQNKASYQRNRENRLVGQRKYYKENKTTINKRNRQYYLANMEQVKESFHKYYLKKKEFLANEKIGKKCFKCGLVCTNPATHDFHHKDPKNKLFSISHIGNASIDLLKKEIAKCILYCAICHRLLHNGN
jgi:hypothetical protein